MEFRTSLKNACFTIKKHLFYFTFLYICVIILTIKTFSPKGEEAPHTTKVASLSRN